MHDLNIPQDVLFCICEELANLQDFGTLFNCARTGSALAGIALGRLYQIRKLTSLTISFPSLNTVECFHLLLDVLGVQEH